MRLFAPMMEVGTAGNDSVKYKAAVQNLITASDTVATELTKISSETSDSELKSGIALMVANVQKMKQAVVQFSGAPRKLESVLNSGNFNAGSDRLKALCAS